MVERKVYFCKNHVPAKNPFNETKKALHEVLSDREFDVFKLLASGKTITEIAIQLSLSSTTVSTYRSRIMEKMKMKRI